MYVGLATLSQHNFYMVKFRLKDKSFLKPPHKSTIQKFG